MERITKNVSNRFVDRFIKEKKGSADNHLSRPIVLYNRDLDSNWERAKKKI